MCVCVICVCYCICVFKYIFFIVSICYYVHILVVYVCVYARMNKCAYAYLCNLMFICECLHMDGHILTYVSVHPVAVTGSPNLLCCIL